MFYIMNDNKIISFDEDKQVLIDRLLFLPNLSIENIYETDKEIINIEGNNYFSDSIELLNYNKEQRKKEILKELDNIDLVSIRALRAGENNKLLDLEKEAQKLRQELARLSGENE